MRTLILGLACLVALTTTLFATPWQRPAPPPLGDVARQSKAAPKPKATKTITDEDVRHSTEIAPDPKPAAKPDAKPATGAATAAAKTEAPDAAAKPATAAAPAASTEAQRIAELKKDQESLKSIIKQMEAKIANEKDDNRIATFAEVLGHTRQRLEDNQKELEKLESQNPATSAPPQ